MKWFAIFRTGKHKDSKGREREWSKDDLDRIVELNSGVEVPIVIGHPEVSSPAYGWADQFKREGEILYAKPKQVVEEFAEWVKEGLWKKISISIRPKDFTLRHIGFLGGTPPAVQGLPAVEFIAGDDALTIEFSDVKMSAVGRIFQRLREFIIEKFGSDIADKVISAWELEDLQRGPEAPSSFAEDSPGKKAQQARSKEYGIGIKEGGNVTKPSEYDDIDDDEFADPVNYRYPIDAGHVKAALSYWGMPKNREQYTSGEVKKITGRILKAAKRHGIEVDEEKWKFSEKEEDMDKIQELETKLKEREKEISEFSEKDKTKDAEMARLKKELADERAKNRKAEFAAFCDSDEMKEKITPAMKPAVMDFLEILSGIEEYEFAEGDSKVKKAPSDAFKTFLKTLPKAVEFSEVATKGKAASKQGGDAGEKLDAKAKEKMKANKEMSYGAAFAEAQAENPELAQEYADELRGGK